MASIWPSGDEAEFYLSPEDVKVLQESNVFQFLPGSSSEGKHKISASFLKPPPWPPRSISGSSSAGSPSASIQIKHSGSNVFRETNLINFPTSMSSRGALEFIGLTPAAADKVFRHWSEVSGDPDEMMEFVKNNVRPFFGGSLDDREAMTRAGLTADIQNRILDPQFDDVRGTEQTWHWVKETLTLNYGALGRFQRQLKALAKSTAAQKTKPSSVQGTFTPPPAAGESSQAVPSTSATTSRIRHHLIGLPENWVSVIAEAPVYPSEDYVVLYKGHAVEQDRYDAPAWYPGGYFIGDDVIGDDGSVNLEFLGTQPGGDFNSRRMAQYWTPEYETAERRRLYAERRLLYTETWLVQIAIPRKFLDTLRTNQLWYSPDWKEFVWWCRRRYYPPDKFKYLYQQTELLKGHILNKPSPWITRIQPADVQTKLDGSHLMMLANGKKATQWAFLLDDANKIRRLSEEVRGKVHIEITVPTNRQGE